MLGRLSALLTSATEASSRLMVATVMLSRARPWTVLLAAALLTVVSVFYTVHSFNIQTNTISLLFHRSKVQKINQQLEKAFPSLRDRIIVIIDGDTPHLAEHAAERLASRLKEDRKQFATVYIPGGGPFFRQNGLLYLSEADLRRLSRQLVLAEPLLGRVAQDPSLRGLFGILGQMASHSSTAGNPVAQKLPSIFDGLRTSIAGAVSGKSAYMDWGRLFKAGVLGANNRSLVVITLPPGADSPTDAHAALRVIRRTERTLELNPAHGVKLSLTGSIVLNLEQLAAVTSGARLSTVLSLVLVTLILVFGLRSLKLLLAVLTTLLLGLLWTSAFAVLAVGPFNLISVAFAVLFIGLGVDFGIQFCVRYQEELQRSLGSSAAAMRFTARRMGPALALAAVAAAASFYSVVPTGYSGIRDLGVIAGSGAFIALLANLTVLPALLTVFRAGRGNIPRPPIPFHRFPAHRAAMPILLVALALAAASAFIVPRVSFDFNLAKLQNQHSEAVKALYSLEKTSPFSPFSIEGLAPNLSVANREAAKAQRLSSVAQAVTLSSFVPRHQTDKLSIIASTAAAVPPFALAPPVTAPAPSASEACKSIAAFSRTLATFALSQHGAVSKSAASLAAALRGFTEHERCDAQLVARLRELIVVPLVQDIHGIATALQPHRITLSALPQELRRQYVAPDGRARISIYSSLNLQRTDALRKFVGQVEQVVPDAGGTSVLFVKGGNIVVSAFREATLIAIGLILLVIFAVFRHPVRVLLALVPLALSVLLTVALMGVFHLNFNLANIIVMPLTIGLSVAFGIYVIVRWEDSGYSIRKVLNSSIPEGVLVSGLTTLASFGSLSVSSDPAMASLGKTLAIALTLILITSLIVLPAFLAVVERHMVALKDG